MEKADRRKRLEELATELLGDQIATRLLDEMWAEASPELKRELSNALLKKVSESSLNSYTVDEYIRRDVATFVENALGDQIDTVKTVVRKAVSSFLTNDLNDVIKAKVNDVIKKSVHEVVDRLRLVIGDKEREANPRY